MFKWAYVIAVVGLLAVVGLGVTAYGVPRLDTIQPASVRVGSTAQTQTRSARRRGHGGIFFIGGWGGGRRSGRYSGGGGFGFGGK